MTQNTTQPHWMHVKFKGNLVTASRAPELAQAAQEWTLERIGHADEQNLRCNLCNTRVSLYVILANTINGNKLILGADCYDKLVRYIKTAALESKLRPWSTHSQQLKNYWKQITKDVTVNGWFKEQLKIHAIPNELVPIALTVTKHGFASTEEDADRLVEYYRQTRMFPTAILVPEARFLVDSGRVPKEITILKIADVLKQVEEERKFQENRAKDNRWTIARNQIIETVKLHAPKIQEALEQNKPFAVEAAEAMLKLLKGINEKLPERRPDHINQASIETAPVFNEIREEINAWEYKFTELLNEPVEAVIHPGSNYILTQTGKHWYSVRAEFLCPLPEKGGRYQIYAKRLPNQCIVQKIIHPEEPLEKLLRVEFNIPDTKNLGNFIGEWKGKWILPEPRINNIGVRDVYILGAESNYYKAWAFAPATHR